MNKSVYNANIVDAEDAARRAKNFASIVSSGDEMLRTKIESGYYEQLRKHYRDLDNQSSQISKQINTRENFNVTEKGPRKRQSNNNSGV